MEVGGGIIASHCRIVSKCDSKIYISAARKADWNMHLPLLAGVVLGIVDMSLDIAIVDVAVQ